MSQMLPFMHRTGRKPLHWFVNAGLRAQERDRAAGRDYTRGPLLTLEAYDYIA